MIFIPGNTPSSKNEKVWNGKFLMSGKTTRRYQNNTVFIYRAYKTKFKKMVGDRPYPLKVGFFFIRDSKHRFDYTNVVAKVADMMVGEGWLDDDDMDHFIPIFLGYKVDKKNAGVEITVLEP